MIRTSTRRLTVTAVAAVAAIATAAPPAVAVDTSFSKRSGGFAQVEWLEVGPMPEASGVAGNAHFGHLYVQDLGGGRATAFGTVFDVECEEGVDPYLPGGHHGGPFPPGVPGEFVEPEGCELVGTRSMGGDGLAFDIDRRLDRATLTGTLTVSDGHGGPATGQPPVNIAFAGVGGTRTERGSGTSVDEFGARFTYRHRQVSRSAEIAAGSLIGPMVFDDEPGEFSTASIGTQRSMDRFRR